MFLEEKRYKGSLNNYCVFILVYYSDYTTTAAEIRIICLARFPDYSAYSQITRWWSMEGRPWMDEGGEMGEGEKQDYSGYN